MEITKIRYAMIGALTFAMSLMLLMIAVRPTSAALAPNATFTVDFGTDAGDSDPGNGTCATDLGFCTLRAAIEESNALTGADFIEFSPVLNLFPFTPATPFAVTDDVTISGNGTLNTVVNGSGATQLFTITGGVNVTMEDLTLREGSALTGGAIQNAGTLNLLGVDLIENEATGATASEGGGAIFNSGTAILSDTNLVDNTAVLTSGSGGGIFNAGTLTINSSTFTGNNAVRAGGAIETIANAAVTLSDVTMDGNNAGPNPGNGGALHMTGQGTVVVLDSTFTHNTASTEGGGLWNETGAMTITNSTVSTNTASGEAADDGGGGLFNNGGTLNVVNSTITNNAAAGTSGSGGGIMNNVGGNLTVDGGTIAGNTANRAGGGVEDNAAPNGDNQVVLNNVTLTNNQAGSNPGNGGGLHITGPGTAAVIGGTVQGNSATSEGGGLWNSAAGTLMVNGVMVEGNTAQGNDSDNGGGGVFNDGGSLTLMATTLNNNQANGTSGSGGGILNVNGGNLTVSGSTITGNSANRAGGGIEDNATITATTTVISATDIASNTLGANPGNGGGYHMTGAGTADVDGGRVYNNSAANEGGGLWNGTGTMTITGTLIENNSAAGAAADTGGGGLHNNGGTLIVTDAMIRNNQTTGAAGSGGGILNDVGGTLTVTSSQITGNSSVRAGGGIEDNAGAGMQLLGVELSNNTTGDAPGNGGGLHITGAGTVTIQDSTVSGNTATEGGGLWNSAAGTLTVDGTTINGNIADGTADGQDGGGGIYTDGGLTVFNSTISGNNSASMGGGVSVVGASGAAVLTHVTIYQNRAGIDAGGIATMGGAATLINSIVAHTADTGSDCSGTIVANAPNLASDDSCGATIVGNAALGSLANNGGATRTHIPFDNSPALNTADAGSCAAAPVSGVDQRDMARPMGEGCDLGAVETDGMGGDGSRLIYFPLIQRAQE